jgi:multidrug efflux system membrane fusion protein
MQIKRGIKQILFDGYQKAKSLFPKKYFDSIIAVSHEQYQRRPRITLFILLAFIALVLVRCGLFSHSKKLPELPVVLTNAHLANVPVYLTGLGSVIPTYTVTVRTQVNGQLLQVLFREGQMVKAGDLLAQIDPRPYQAQLLQYEGQLERDKALLANAKLDLKRYQTLWRQDSVAKQTLDTQASVVKQNEGIVKLDEGLLQSTKVNLIYCNIISPINGRIGLRLVDPGNFVQTSDTAGIAIINMLNPITVVFSLPEDNISQVMTQINAGKVLVVEAYDRQQNKLLATGKLMTIDNQIDPTTGTVKLKASFQNENNLLFPNQFVNVKLLVTVLHNATVIPTAAIQHGPQNDFVYIANKDQTVTMKPIVSGITIGDNTVIQSGVTAGQAVVIDGADKLSDGAHISTPDAISPQKNHRRPA